MIREVLKRRRSSPFLALKEHGYERAHQHHCGRDLRTIEASNLPHAISPGAIAYLIMILDIAEEPVLGDIARRAAVDAIAKP